MRRSTIAAITLSLLLAVACEPPKTRKEQKVEAAEAALMAHFKLELWQDIAIQSAIGQDADVQMKTLKSYTTPPIAFDIWVGAGDDVKTFATLPDGRIAFVRFYQLVLHAKTAESSGWGFEVNFQMQTGSDAGSPTVAVGPYNHRAPINPQAGQSLDARLSGYADTSKEPSVLYTPVARLTLVETMPFAQKISKSPEKPVKLPPELSRQIETDREGKK